MLKKFKLKLDQKRATVKHQLFKEFITNNTSIVDVGTGSGQFAALLKNKGYNITAVDVVNKTNTNQITPVIYDGKTLPFSANTFNIGMLITVLHHCPNPELVFNEVCKVSKNKIFVLEDVYNNQFMKYLTWFADSLANFEFIGHPHTNKSEKEWETLFKYHDLKLIHKKKVKVMVIFTQVVYVLEKNN